MAKTPEGYVKGQVKQILTSAGITYSMKTTMGFGKSGWPDFDVVFRGVYVTIETKYDLSTQRPTMLQRDMMENIRKSGGITLLLDIKNYHYLADLIQITNADNNNLIVLQPETVRIEAMRLGIYYSGVNHGKTSNSE